MDRHLRFGFLFFARMESPERNGQGRLALSDVVEDFFISRSGSTHGRRVHIYPLEYVERPAQTGQENFMSRCGNVNQPAGRARQSRMVMPENVKSAGWL